MMCGRGGCGVICKLVWHNAVICNAEGSDVLCKECGIICLVVWRKEVLSSVVKRGVAYSVMEQAKSSVVKGGVP